MRVFLLIFTVLVGCSTYSRCPTCKVVGEYCTTNADCCGSREAICQASNDPFFWVSCDATICCHHTIGVDHSCELGVRNYWNCGSGEIIGNCEVPK